MAGINTGININDGMSPVLKTMQQSLQMTVNAMSSLHDAVGTGIDTGSLDTANEMIRDLGATLSELDTEFALAADTSSLENATGHLHDIEQATKDSANAQKEYNNAINNGVDGMSQMANTIKNIFVTQMLAKGVNFLKDQLGTGIAVSDNYNTLTSQIGMMNDGLQTNAELQGMIEQSAAKTRSSYMETASLITKMATTSGSLFENNASMIQFLETFQQATIASGATADQQIRAMNALDTAMAKGVMHTSELNTLLETSGFAVEAIANELEVGTTELRGMASEGKITADIIAAAMFNSVDSINEKFNSMPDTWEDHMTRMSNFALTAFQPLMEAFSNFLNSDQFYDFLDGIAVAISFIAAVATVMFNVFQWGFNLIVDHSNVILPILGALAIAAAVLAVTMLAAGIASSIAGNAMMIAWIQALWPVFLIIAAIGLLIAVLNYFGISTSTIIGFVAGLFGALYASLYNIFAALWNIFAATAEYLVNVFSHGTYTTKKLLYNLVYDPLNWFADFIEGTGEVGNAIGEAITKGVNIAIGALNWLSEKLSELSLGVIDLGQFQEKEFKGVDSVASSIRRFADGLDPGEAPDGYWEAPKMDYKNIADTASSWYNNTKGFLDGIANIDTDWDEDLRDRFDSGLSDSLLDALGDAGKGSGSGSGLGSGAGKALDDIAKNTGSTAGNLGKGNEIGDIGTIKNDVTISDEDIKLMKDMAEQRFLLNYKQITPNATIQVNGDINNDADAEKLLEKMEDMLEEQLASALVTD